MTPSGCLPGRLHHAPGVNVGLANGGQWNIGANAVGGVKVCPQNKAYSSACFPPPAGLR